MTEDRTRDVAIVGMAAMFPAAGDVDGYWRNVVNGVDAITEIPEGRWPHVNDGDRLRVGGLDLARRGGFIPTPVPFDALRHRVVPSTAASPTFDQFVVIDLVDRALSDAGVKPDDPVREVTDLVIGRGGYPSAGVARSMAQADGIEWFTRYMVANLGDLTSSDRDAIHDDIRERVGGYSPEAVEATVPNFVASRTANRLDLRGASYVVDAACASSLIAVEHVVDRLRAGRSELGVAAGVNFFQYPAFWWMLGTVGALSASGRCRPFDTGADGIVLSEGAGVLVLKRVIDAERDGNEVYAVIKGVGSSSDGRGSGLLAPSSSGQRLALERAYRDAQVTPDSVGMLEAHGTGTKIGDAAEARTIRDVFGERAGRFPLRPMGSVKSMIGHSIPASGMASLIKAALSLRDKVIPPTLNTSEPIDALSDGDFYVNPELRPWVHAIGGGPRRAAVNAFGFGGVNSHVVLEEVDAGRPASAYGRRSRSASPGVLARPTVSVVDRPTELVVTTADTREGLGESLRDVLAAVDAAGVEVPAETVAAELARRCDVSLPWRLVCVRPAQSYVAEIGAIAGLIESGAGSEGALDDLGVRIAECDATDGAVAALLGGSAPGLQSDLPEQQLVKALHMPSFRYVLDVVEHGTGRADDPYPVSFQLRTPPGIDDVEARRMRLRFSLGEVDESRPGSEWPLLQSVMPAIKYGAWLAISDLGLNVERLVAISSGEVTALCAAGVVGFEPTIELLTGLFSDERYVGFEWSTIRSGFIFASPDQLEPFLERHREVQISMYLAENMVTLCGRADAFADLQAELRENGLAIAEMPLAGIHSRLLEPIADALVEDIFENLELAEPSLPIQTATAENTTQRTAAELVVLAAECVKRPLFLWHTLRRLSRDGVDTVVELGPTPHHAQFVSDAPEGTDVHGLVTEAANVHPVTQLQGLVADLLLLGKRVDPEGLFVGRRPGSLEPRGEATGRELPLSTTWEPLGDPETAPGRWRDSVSSPRRRPERPLVGEILERAGDRLVQRLRLDLDVDTHLVDHTFVSNDGRPPEERFPVVALTVLVEVMAQTALELTAAPAVIRVNDVKVSRWVSLDGIRHRDVEISAEIVHAEPAGVASSATVVTTVCVDGKVHGSASFVVGDAPGASPGPMTPFAHTDDVRGSLTPAQVYGDRLFFHGEAFQCLHGIDAVSSAGLTGRLVTRDPGELFAGVHGPVLALDPVVLDGVGQLIASWFLGSDHRMLPTMIDQIEVFTATPRPGTVVDVTAVPREVSVDAYYTVFDVEVGDGAGSTWMRITGFRDWMFSEHPALAGLRYSPSTHMMSSPVTIPGLPADVTVTLMERFALNDLQLAIMPRISLHPEEYRQLGRIDSRRRRVDYVLGRNALKDAVRLAVGGVSWPHTVVARLVDEKGLVVQVPGTDARLSGSITHGPAGVAAVVGPRPVGIDLESFVAVDAVEAASFCTAEEEALGAGVVESAAWRCALWVAKEACAKRAGSGLGGRPLRWQISGCAPDASVVAVTDMDTSAVIEVRLAWFPGSVLAVAVADHH